MRRAFIAIFAAAEMLAVLGAHAEEKRGPIVTTPENARFLYERVLSVGHLVIKVYDNHPDSHMERTFSVLKPGNCLDINIEAQEHKDMPAIVFDSWCQLPFGIGDKTYYVWGQVRMVILVKTGEVGLGGTPWIDTNSDGTGTSLFPDERSVVGLLNKTISDIIDKEKKFIAFMEEHKQNAR